VVGQPNDPLEHEADRVADKVMRMLAPDAVTTSAPPQVSRNCATCEAEEEEKLQKRDAGTTEAVAAEAPSIVHEVLRSPGEPLAPSSRSFFEPRLRYDFSCVRVHADARAAESARAVNALAYTYGNHIAFDTGQYAPKSDPGKELLVHELVHVAQQRAQGAAIVARQPTQKQLPPDAPLPSPPSAAPPATQEQPA
jgi:hypothetical protein